MYIAQLFIIISIIEEYLEVILMSIKVMSNFFPHYIESKLTRQEYSTKLSCVRKLVTLLLVYFISDLLLILHSG